MFNRSSLLCNLFFFIKKKKKRFVISPKSRFIILNYIYTCSANKIIRSYARESIAQLVRDVSLTRGFRVRHPSLSLFRDYELYQGEY